MALLNLFVCSMWLITLLLCLPLLSACAEDWEIETGLADPPHAIDDQIWNTEVQFLGFTVKVSSPFSRPDLAPDMVVGCLSGYTPENVELRQAVRDTWARTQEGHDRAILVWFLMATPDTPEVLEEARQHNDLLFVNVKDSYRFALTPKVQVFYSVATKIFPNTPWIMKTDDDAFVLFDSLYEHLDRLQDPMEHPIEVGRLWSLLQPVRDPSSKWFISKEAFPDDSFPQFMSGMGMLLSNKLAKCHTPNLSIERNFVGLEDVFTGVLLERYCRPYTAFDIGAGVIDYTWYDLAEDQYKVLVHEIKNPDYFWDLWHVNCKVMTHCDPKDQTLAQQQLSQARIPSTLNPVANVSSYLAILFIPGVVVTTILFARVLHRRKNELPKAFHSDGLVENKAPMSHAISTK